MISRLWVKNYRSLADVDVTLEPLTILVGPNGSGKSNLVDVLRFISDAVRLGLDTAVSSRRGIRGLMRVSPHEILHEIEIGLEFTTEDVDGSYCIVLQTQGETGSDYKLKKEAYNIQLPNGNEVSFEFSEGQWIIWPDTSLPPPDLRNTLFLPLMSATETYQDLNSFLRQMSFYSITFPYAAHTTREQSSPHPLQSGGENLASALYELQNSKQYNNLKKALRIATNDDVIDCSAVTFTPIDPNYVGIFLKHQNQVELGISQESDGTLRILGILTALYQEPSRSFIAFEEPELNIHPWAIAVLWDEFDSSSKRSQIVLTTHSPDLLDLCQPEQLRIVEKINGVTHIGPLEEPQTQMIQERLIVPGQLLQEQGLYRAQP